MGDFTVVPGKLRPLLTKIRSVGVPPKVTVQWLKTVGFTSSNDVTLIGVLKFIGLIDASNVPTPTWTRYRGADHKKVLGEAVRKGYDDLFGVYPDADRRPNSDLEHVFSTSSSGGKQVIDKTVASFKALVAEAEFSEAGKTELRMARQFARGHLPCAAVEQPPQCLHMAAGPLQKPPARCEFGYRYGRTYMDRGRLVDETRADVSNELGPPPEGLPSATHRVIPMTLFRGTHQTRRQPSERKLRKRLVRRVCRYAQAFDRNTDHRSFRALQDRREN
jgi:hypothetical protein